MTTATSSFGLALEYSADDSSYTRVAQVVDVNGPKPKAESKDVTNQDSTEGWREKIACLKDAGQVVFNVIHVKAAATALFALLGVTRYWRITLPNSQGIWKCQGFVTEGPVQGAPLEDKMTLDVTVELTGKPTFT